ncbi:MAG TPA: adenylate/guanylate cyclase domain-containing protein [Anaerolineales bacterium]|nr:adenylate/guanylate cyclase domain-containing protein [Anaerolineales bacterium]
MNCPNCGFNSPSSMRFCGLCGTRLTINCPECSSANPLDYRFCGMCGTRLNGEAEPLVHAPSIFLPKTEDEPLLPAETSPLEGERRVVTVIVTDLTESTNLLENVGTEGWVDLMNRILHILESEINRFGGEVSQFRGDGLVAFFGATSAHEDDPERAVLASLSMQRTFDLFVRELAQPDAAELRMRVGINTGEVIVPSGSDRQHAQETAMGMAVAIAARMETAAEAGTVLVSEHTYHLIESQFDWDALGEIFVKGVSQPIAVYRPRRHVTDAELPSQGNAFPDAMPLIGHEDEFQMLKSCVQSLFEGRGGIATLTGEKGYGKSFLLNEVRHYFAHRRALLSESEPTSSSANISVTWVRSRCRSYSQTWPYSMWLELFRDWLGLRPDASKEEKRATLYRRAQEIWGAALEEHYPYLATFLGLPLEDNFTEKIRHLDGEGLRQRFFIAVRSWIEGMSRNGPLVLSFSDMQWVDDSSLSLLKYCLPICDNESLLWLMSFRPERETSIWEFNHYLEVEYPHRLTSVELLPLTPAQSLKLINHLIGSETLPEETSNLILRNAEGNPYYILELIQALIAKDVLEREPENGPWRLTRPVTTLDLPNSLQRLLLARIDRLTAQQRLILQIAAVIGSVFWQNMLNHLLGDSPRLKTDLAALQRAQLIQESGRVPELGMQYFFKSPLVRETVYDSLLSAQRITFHLRAAEYLENIISQNVLSEYDGMLAYHYRGAGNHRKELFYTFLAAENERKIYANAEALQDYTRVLELLGILERETPSNGLSRSIQTQRFEALNGRRQVYFRLGKFEEARADTQALLPLARQMADDPVWLVDALLAQSQIARDDRKELVPGLHMAEEALSLAKQSGEKRRIMQSLDAVADIRFTLNDPGWREFADHAVSLAKEFGDLRTEVKLLLAISGKYGSDDLPRGREYLQEALARSETLNDKATKLAVLNAIGLQFERDGDYYQQLTKYEQERLRLSREIGNRIVEGNALMFCGQIQALYLGDYEKGLQLQIQTLNFWENITDRLFPLLRIAQIQTEMEHHEEALAALELARPLQEKVVLDIGRAGFGLVSAILYNSLGDEASLRSSLSVTSQIQQMVSNSLVSRQYHMVAACEASLAHLKLAQLLTKKEDGNAESQYHLPKALEYSQTALQMYEEFGFVQVVECTSEEVLFRHSCALTANGRTEEGTEFLKRAHKEMMRKYELIPTESPYRKTYLENIKLHRDIQAAHKKQTSSTAKRRKTKQRA